MSTPQQPNRDLILRPRREVTLPTEICEALGIATGDRLEWRLTEQGLVVRPKKRAALDALRAIQGAFAATEVTEEEIQGEGRAVREQLTRARYGDG
jgi:bifunctional DNA-binding transcriptional regulator/antitoxin component of YhaV-PrlF toxin-antitoxin module